MVKRGATGLLIGLGFVLAACDDPVAPAREIAGEYELTARVENEIETPVPPGSPGATLTLRPDRTWLLTRHRGGFDPLGGFGLADTYQLEPSGSGFSLAMFSETPFLETLSSGAAFVDGDTLRWGAEIFVRR